MPPAPVPEPVVVPARAGMSPADPTPSLIALGGPRASGDEPAETAELAQLVAWSPRERG